MIALNPGNAPLPPEAGMADECEDVPGGCAALAPLTLAVAWLCISAASAAAALATAWWIAA